jgi:hypothetical protein
MTLSQSADLTVLSGRGFIEQRLPDKASSEGFIKKGTLNQYIERGKSLYASVSPKKAH